MSVPATFRAFRIHDDADGYRGGIEMISLDDLNPGEVVVKAAYSSVNYKDALAGTGKGKILRRFPLVGGIDVAGHVVASTDPSFKEGDAVLVTGSGLSETRDGGYAEYALADARYCLPLPAGHDDAHAAPLLCAGLIGYRAYAMTGAARRLGLYGFGAAGHIVAQLAVAQGREVYAFTRDGDLRTQHFARSLGAAWAGASTGPAPVALDAAILFAPDGALVPLALAACAKGATVVCAGIHMSDLPAMPYSLLWGERSVRSVANLTRADGLAFMALAERFNLKTAPSVYPLLQANEALADLRAGRFDGAAVLLPTRMP